MSDETLREALDLLDKIEGQAVCGPLAVDMEEAREMLGRISTLSRKAIEALAHLPRPRPQAPVDAGESLEAFLIAKVKEMAVSNHPKYKRAYAAFSAWNGALEDREEGK